MLDIHPKLKFSLVRAMALLNVVGTLCCFYCLLDAPHRLYLLIVIPSAYTILFLMYQKAFNFKSPGLSMFMLIAFLRYIIMPLAILWTRELSQISYGIWYLDQAIFLMLFEMLAMMCVIRFVNISFPTQTNPPRISKIVKIGAISLFLLLLLSGKMNIVNLSILERTTDSATHEAIAGPLALLWNAVRIFVFSCLVYDIRKKFIHSVWLTTLIGLLYIYIVYIGQTEISRWQTVLTLSAVMFYLFKLYPKSRKTILFICLLPGMILLTSATLHKNTSLQLSSHLHASEVISDIFTPTIMDIYFAGPVNINNAIVVKQSNRIGLESMFYDIFQNFPTLSHYVNSKKSSVNTYNQFLFRNDQILPLIGQSVIWFSYALAPLLSVLSVLAFKYFDAKYLQSCSIYTFLYAFISTWLSVAPILNATICLASLYVLIPVFMLFKISSVFHFHSLRNAQ